jgi:S-adenosylmethionine:tRNA-ribosyltransferase-isomerase (queuine synthetase)
MDINSLRIRESNLINIDIREKQQYIKRNNDTISRLRNSESTVFNKTNIEKLKQTIIKYEYELNVLQNRILDLNKGLLDSELKNKSVKNSEEIKKKTDEKFTKKTNEKIAKKEGEGKNLQISYNMNRQRNWGEASEKDMDKELHRYIKICDTIPSYILNNLKEMPSNKGYIWKGAWCFGNLPEEPGQPLIMFEKLRDSILRIHEIDDKYITIHEKQGKNRKILISKEPRNMNIVKETKLLLSKCL